MTTSGSGGQGRRYLGRLVGSATSDGQSGSGYYASFRPVYAIAPTCNAYSGSGISSRFLGRFAGVATSGGQSGSGYYALTRPVYVRGECADGYSGSGASPRGRIVSRFAGVATSDGQSGSGYYATTRPVYVFPCCDSVHSGGSGGSGSSGSGYSGSGSGYILVNCSGTDYQLPRTLNLHAECAGGIPYSFDVTLEYSDDPTAPHHTVFGTGWYGVYDPNNTGPATPCQVFFFGCDNRTPPSITGLMVGNYDGVGGGVVYRSAVFNQSFDPYFAQSINGLELPGGAPCSNLPFTCGSVDITINE